MSAAINQEVQTPQQMAAIEMSLTKICSNKYPQNVW